MPVDPTERAWAAGFFDGEGCFHLDRRKTGWAYPVVSLVQANSDELLRRFERAIELNGSVYAQERPPYKVKYTLRYRGRDAFVAVRDALWPWLGTVKREQATAMLAEVDAYQSKHPRERTHCLRGHPFDEANTYHSKSGRRHCRACARERHMHSRLVTADVRDEQDDED